ncbi:hypothetical protein EDD37DRAFT_616467 [Exophiala viscosa]|uniref:General stress protein FMN-binding split barrel domain-containing protein n=1 Tax=Exophiala viscosa TaxID=2486360 RepID=A0AAN6E5Z2_9EURO|nr:hypothetical protein EDD36DRAFT_157582 [Exophiala viscosa]KAI1629245.1 hypothetical protein EDD37DRAFT_616467 [Exophiala viscosa]
MTSSQPADPYTAKNSEDPSLEIKVNDLNTFIKGQKFGMFTTVAQSGILASRCMALAAQENDIDLLFHTNTESGKTDDIENDSHVNVAFLSSDGSWASISGKANVITDRSVVKKYYTPTLKTWVGDLGDGTHDGSENDPRIGVIKVKATTVTYAVAQGNFISRGVEMVQGVITGEAAKVNQIRGISEQELDQWRSRHA